MKRQSSAEAAAVFLAERERRAKLAAQATGRPARAPIPTTQRTVSMRLPLETYDMLVAHCRNFGIRPATYIRRMLEMSKLSKGGV